MTLNDPAAEGTVALDSIERSPNDLDPEQSVLTLQDACKKTHPFSASLLGVHILLNTFKMNVEDWLSSLTELSPGAILFHCHIV